MARILLAASAISKYLLRAALAEHELLETTTFGEAQRLVLEDGIDLFVICIFFDDSRAMELVTVIRTDPKHKQTPILVVRVTPSEMADFIRHTMNTMKTLHVISDYLELDGDPIADIKIGDAAKEYLPSEKRIVKKRRAR